MEQAVNELREMMSTLTKEDQRFAVAVKESGRETKAAFEKVVYEAHKMHSQIQKHILKLEAVIQKIK